MLGVLAHISVYYIKTREELKMELIKKYPRTRHIEGSRIQTGDEDLDCIAFDAIKDSYVVLEEKVDGANCGISFDKNGNLLLQSRGHFLTGGFAEHQFDLLKAWAMCKKTSLYELLTSRYILYGEWLYAKHTCFYDKLPHYFLEFDIFDKGNNCFLSTKKRQELLKEYDFIHSVKILYEGVLKEKQQLISYLGNSYFKSEQSFSVLKEQCERLQLSYELVKQQTDDTLFMEGIYIKAEGYPDSDKEDIVLNRYKYVRPSFLTTILNSETHWANRPIVANQLKEGIDLFTSRRES